VGTFGKNRLERRETQDEIKTHFQEGGGGESKEESFMLQSRRLNSCFMFLGPRN
jgi:hypothetical protein